MTATTTVNPSRPAPDILLLTLNRPANRNAVNGAMINAFCYEIDRASRDPSIRVIVLTGNPEGRAFSVSYSHHTFLPTYIIPLIQHCHI